MPMLDNATATMTTKMTPPQLAQSATQANMFAQLPLPAQFVYPTDQVRQGMLQAYLDALPIGIQESIRATIYLALTSNPPKPMTFKWEGAYDFKIQHTETFDTFNSPKSAGVIGITIFGRYPDDPHPLAGRIEAQARRGRRASSARRAAKGSVKPAKRKASKRK